MGDKACMDIQYFDRTTGKIETEKVYGEKAVKFIYDSFLILEPGQLKFQKEQEQVLYGTTKAISSQTFTL
jgi:hypothetical protein